MRKLLLPAILSVFLLSCGGDMAPQPADGMSADAVAPDQGPIPQDATTGADSEADQTIADQGSPDRGIADQSGVDTGREDGAAHDGTVDLPVADATEDLASPDGGRDLTGDLDSDDSSTDASRADVDADTLAADGTVDADLCPAQWKWCDSLNTCIPEANCCTSADCASPKVCPTPGSVCHCVNACSVESSYKCVSGSEHRCAKNGDCLDWVQGASCNHGCGASRCMVNVNVTLTRVPCYDKNTGKSWDDNTFGNGDPDPYLRVIGPGFDKATSALKNTCSSLTLTLEDLGLIDPSLSPVVEIRGYDNDVLDADDLLCAVPRTISIPNTIGGLTDGCSWSIRLER